LRFASQARMLVNWDPPPNVRSSVMGKRAITAGVAALSALFLAAVPALADQESLGTDASIDWRLVIVLSVLAVLVFHAVLEFVNRGR
jgi:hypothetical protein